MKIKDGACYEERVFDDVDFKRKAIQSSTFEQCRFVACDFSESEVLDCRFVECVFQDSNLNVARFDGTGFIETEFRNCKVTGINWTSLDRNSVALSAPLRFDACDVSFCVFNGLKLPELKLTRCKAHDVDFSDCDLSGADFSETDLANSRFDLSRLYRCNFKGAVNYSIDPQRNSVEGARFSVPDVFALLSPFKVRIDGMD